MAKDIKNSISTRTPVALAISSLAMVGMQGAWADSPDDCGRWCDDGPPNGGKGFGPDGLPGGGGNGKGGGILSDDNLLTFNLPGAEEEGLTDAAIGDWTIYAAYGGCCASSANGIGKGVLMLRPDDSGGSFNNGTLNLSLTDFPGPGGPETVSIVDNEADFYAGPDHAPFDGNQAETGTISSNHGGNDFFSGTAGQWGFNFGGGGFASDNGKFVAGQPTTLADMGALDAGNVTADYFGSNFYSGHNLEINVDFGAGTWMGDWTGGSELGDLNDFSAAGTINGPDFTATAFGDGAASSSSIDGTFFGGIDVRGAPDQLGGMMDMQGTETGAFQDIFSGNVENVDPPPPR